MFCSKQDIRWRVLLRKLLIPISQLILTSYSSFNSSNVITSSLGSRVLYNRAGGSPLTEDRRLSLCSEISVFHVFPDQIPVRLILSMISYVRLYSFVLIRSRHHRRSLDFVPSLEE